MLNVDANIVVPLLIVGATTKNTIALLDFDVSWCTEPFAMVELANILATYERQGLITQRDALEKLEIASQLLRNNFYIISHEQALEVAMNFRISTYDARYLSIAISTGQRLITEDKRLRKAAPELTMSLDEALQTLL